MRRELLIAMTLALITVCHVRAGAAASEALSENDLLRLLAGGVYNARIASLVHDRGIDFVPTAHDLELLQRAGAEEALLDEVTTVPRILPQVTQPSPEPSPQLHSTPQSNPKPSIIWHRMDGHWYWHYTWNEGAMNLRNGATLTLLWYLLASPTLPDGPVNDRAPLANWEAIEVFDTEAKCRVLADVMREDALTYHSDATAQARAQAMKCIASNDLRLEKQ
jgi:hypothetical protein